MRYPRNINGLPKAEPRMELGSLGFTTTPGPCLTTNHPRWLPAASGLTPPQFGPMVVSFGSLSLDGDHKMHAQTLESRPIRRLDATVLDMVLLLLKSPDPALVAAAEALAGVRVTRLPPAVPQYPPLPVAARDHGPDARIILHVVRNPRLPTTPSFHRFQAFRPGHTIGYALRHGATRKDLREALRAGWLEVSP